MIKSALSKVMWVGRATVFMVGLAVMLAVVLGVATMAAAHTGVDTKLFHLGHSNTSNAITRLVGSVAGPMLRLDNNSTATAATALDLQVEPGKAPMTVNSSKTVKKLSADRLDGKNSTGFVEARGDANGNFFDFRGIVEHSQGFVFYDSGFDEVVAHAPEGPPVDVLLSCPTDQATNGTLRIINKTTEFGDSQDVWVDDGSANPTFDTLSQNEFIDKVVVAGGDHFTIKVASVFSPNRMATIDLFTKHLLTGCQGKAHVIYTFLP
jgi:hypothetical protein